MTKTLVALVLIAGGILLVTRVVDTDKPVPARLSPPTSADQISEARLVSPTMSARDVCNLIDPWQKCSFSRPNIMVVDPKISTASCRRKPLQRVRRRRPRYEKGRQAHGARLDTADPFEQGRIGKLLSPLTASPARRVSGDGICDSRTDMAVHRPQPRNKPAAAVVHNRQVAGVERHTPFAA